VTIAEIARRADLGHGTMFRRFYRPTIDLGDLATGGELQRIRHPLAGVNLIRLSKEREVNVRRLPAQGKTGKRGAISRVPFVGEEVFLGPDLCEPTEQRPSLRP
jgi:hypothetical protein